MKKKNFANMLPFLLFGVLAIAMAVILIISVMNGSLFEKPEEPAPIVIPSQKEESEKTEESESESKKESETEVKKKGELSGTQDVAMFAVDSRTHGLGKGARADSIMLIHVDHDEQTIRIASIYRDTMVSIEGHNYDKVTHAHSYGGPELQLETINKNFDMNFEDYVTVNFDAVGDLIDMIGGVEMDITEAECKFINGYIHETNGVRGTASEDIVEPGVYQLDGTQAVSYSRIRYTEGVDYRRTERQRTVLFKAFEKMKDISLPEKIRAAEILMDEIKTSFSKDEVLTLLKNMADYRIERTTGYPQVFYGGSVEKSWKEVPCTLVDMNKGLHNFLFDEETYAPSETVQQISDEMMEKVKGPNTDLTGIYDQL